MQIRIGTSPDSWGVWFPDEPRQPPAAQFLDEAAAAGYDWIELGPCGYLPTDADTLRQTLQSHGLQVAGTFIMGDLASLEGRRRMEHEAEKTGRLLQTLGASHLVLIDDTYTNLFTGEQTGARELPPDQWQYLIESSNIIGRQVRERFDLQLVFHPHVETHVELEPQIEAFLEATDPAFVGLCLDTGHHAYRGGDPVSFFRQHHARIPYLHLKSVDAQVRREVEERGIPFAPAVEKGVFCEPSQGMVDFAALRNELEAVDFAGWAIVEQDMFPVAEIDQPLPIARRTRAYLKHLGFG